MRRPCSLTGLSPVRARRRSGEPPSARTPCGERCPCSNAPACGHSLPLSNELGSARRAGVRGACVRSAKAVDMHQSQFPHADRIAKCYPVNIHHGFDRKGQPGAAWRALRRPVPQLGCSPFAGCGAVSLERIGHISPDLCVSCPQCPVAAYASHAARTGQIAAHGHAGAAAGVPTVPSREQGRQRPRRRQSCGRDDMRVLVRRRRWLLSSQTRRASSCAPPRCWTSRDWASSTRRVWR